MRTLFTETENAHPLLPREYEPVRPEGFEVERIVLTRGSRGTAARREFVERICACYPSAPVTVREDIAHNQVEMAGSDLLARQREGVRTLVFGEHWSAVRLSEERGNTCPNYWHFSVYGYCFYGCSYCYLAGTSGVWNSPTVKIFVNLPEILEQVGRVAEGIGHPVAFYHGKLQDGLALDPLSAYSTTLVPFFAGHAFARQVILTKSDAVGRLLGLEHRGRTILSWSLNPPEIAARFEENVPPVESRIAAMRAAATAGYPVRAVIMPVIPVEGWEEKCDRFIRQLLSRVALQRLTFGGICSYSAARNLLARKVGSRNAISVHLAAGAVPDGRGRYSPMLRKSMYLRLARSARSPTRPWAGTVLGGARGVGGGKRGGGVGEV